MMDRATQNTLMSRPCQFCGNPVGTKDKRQICCSKECGHKNRTLARCEVECSECGKKLIRYAKDLEIRDKFACSLDCQRVIAGRAGGDPEKRAETASRKAKEKWYREQSAKRSMANEWFQACIREICFLNPIKQISDWETKCRTAEQCLRKRNVSPCRDVVLREMNTWKEATATQWKRALAASKRGFRSEWEIRVASAVGCLNKRCDS